MSGFSDFMDKVGAFASKAAEKTKDVASAAATKTKQVSRIAKLNMDISGQKDTIKKAYTELGKLYYEAHHDAPEEGLAQVSQQIDMAMATIASMEEEIVQIQAAMAIEAAQKDVSFESVVDQTEAEADVEVEIHVEEPAGEEDHEEPSQEEGQEEFHEEPHDDGPSWN